MIGILEIGIMTDNMMSKMTGSVIVLMTGTMTLEMTGIQTLIGNLIQDVTQIGTIGIQKVYLI